MLCGKTNKVKEIYAASGIRYGIGVVYFHHTTCSGITQACAFDMSMTGLETLQQDLINAFANHLFSKGEALSEIHMPKKQKHIPKRPRMLLQLLEE